jgi:hypothetical protein
MVSFIMTLYSILRAKLDLVYPAVILCIAMNYFYLFDLEGFRFENTTMQNNRQIMIYGTNAAVLQVLLNFAFWGDIVSIVTSSILALLSALGAFWMSNQGDPSELDINFFDLVSLFFIHISGVVMSHYMITFGEA